MPRALPVATLGDPDPQERVLQRGPGSGQIHGIWAGRALERPLGLAPGFLRLLEIDLAGHVGGLGHHHDLVRPDLQEPADDRERLLGPALADAQLADPEHRHERRMVRQHPQLALDPGQVDGIHGVRIRRAAPG